MRAIRIRYGLHCYGVRVIRINYGLRYYGFRVIRMIMGHVIIGFYRVLKFRVPGMNGAPRASRWMQHTARTSEPRAARAFGGSPPAVIRFGCVHVLLCDCSAI